MALEGKRLCEIRAKGQNKGKAQTNRMPRFFFISKAANVLEDGQVGFISCGHDNKPNGG